jgi:hypothetical protein
MNGRKQLGELPSTVAYWRSDQVDLPPKKIICIN